MSKLRYYAVEYAHDARDVNNGQRTDELRSFPTSAEADCWVADRATEYRTQAGFRQRLHMHDLKAYYGPAGLERARENFQHYKCTG